MSIEPQGESVAKAESGGNYPLKQPAGESVSTLATRIKGAREAAKLSQQEVANHLGVSRQSVAQWEIGANRPSHDKIKKLAVYLNVTESWLILDDKSVNSAADAPQHEADDKNERARVLIREIIRRALELDDIIR